MRLLHRLEAVPMGLHRLEKRFGLHGWLLQDLRRVLERLRVQRHQSVEDGRPVEGLQLWL